MNPRIKITTIGGVVAVFLSVTTYSEELRNYWQESMALDSVEEIVAYIDTLSLDEFKLMGRQAGKDFLRKSQDLPSDEQDKMMGEYSLRLTIYTGGFHHRMQCAEKMYQLFLSFSDPDATLIERWVLVLALDADLELLRRNDYKFIVALDNIMQSPAENTHLRAAACRQVWHSLFHEYRRLARAELSDKNKDSLLRRIEENIKLCRQIVADTNTPPKLRKEAESSLRRYERTGLIEEQQPESEQTPAGDVLKAAPEE